MTALPPCSGGVWTTESAHNLSRQPTDHTSSLFPINDPALTRYRWEDDIIWDSDAVTRIPHPSIPQLDPNDPNIILGYPEELTSSATPEKEGKKVRERNTELLVVPKSMIYILQF